MTNMCTLFATAIAIILPIMISAECQCTASGDPHYVMCDKQTRFDFQAEGLFTAFKSDDLEVQVYQAMAKDKPIAYVDYCSIKFVKDDCNFVMKTRSIKEPNNVVMNGEKMVVTNAPAFISKELDKNLGITMDDNHDMVFKTKEGVVHVICKPQQMIIRAPTTSKCDGLCGNCSGKPQTKPANPVQLACKEVHQPSGSCKPKPVTPAPTPAPSTPSTPAPTNATAAPSTPPPTTNATKAPTPNPTTSPVTNATSAPTTAPATSAPATQPPAPNATATPAPTTTPATPAPTNGTSAAPNTTAPTTAPVMNATSAPTSSPATPPPSSNATSAPTSAPTLPPVNASIAPPPVKEADKSQIVGHPVFESEEVMKKVINACLCGQPKERMDVDKQFGGFVESCIYDKSLGPNEEDVAASNMEAFVKTVTAIPAVAFNNDSAAATPTQARPDVTVIGNLTYSNANFDTSVIREKHVTKQPLEIPPAAGVSYKLRYTIPDEDVALVPQLMPRSQVFTGAGERSEAIVPSPAQQMVMIQHGMPMSPSPMGPSEALSPISSAGSLSSMPGAGASMPGAGASMPAAGASMPGAGASMPGAGASMPGAGASMPGAGASMPAIGASMPAAGASMPGASTPAIGASMPALPGSAPQSSSPGSYLVPSLNRPAMGARPEDRPSDRMYGEKFPSNSQNDDDKLKVRFELEAPVIVSAK